MKKCTKCEVEKEVTEFTKDKSKSSGFSPRCRFCAEESNKKWREANKQRIKDYGKDYRKDNKEQLKEYLKSYSKERRKTDNLYKLKGNLRNLINLYLKGTKSKSTEAILGMDFKAFNQRLGHYDGNTHIDHIIPNNWALNKEEVYALNHYSNFQLLTVEGNMMKGDRFAKFENVRKVFKEHNNKKELAKIILRNSHKLI